MPWKAWVLYQKWQAEWGSSGHTLIEFLLVVCCCFWWTAERRSEWFSVPGIGCLHSSNERWATQPILSAERLLGVQTMSARAWNKSQSWWMPELNGWRPNRTPAAAILQPLHNDAFRWAEGCCHGEVALFDQPHFCQSLEKQRLLIWSIHVKWFDAACVGSFVQTLRV